jgi:hypothetical protein
MFARSVFAPCGGAKAWRVRGSFGALVCRYKITEPNPEQISALLQNSARKFTLWTVAIGKRRKRGAKKEKTKAGRSRDHNQEVLKNEL